MAGFKYLGTEAQGEASGKLKRFKVDAAHSGVIGPGDLVLVTGDADTDGVSEVDIGTANTANTGVVMSVVPNFSGEALSTTHLAASTAGYVLVNVDPDALYEVEVSNGPLSVDDVDLNAPAVVTAGTVSGGLFTSNMGVNDTGAATTSTLPLRIVKLLEDEAGVLGNKAIVKLNETTNRLGATGIA